jgi:hypothetical protein
MSGRDEKRSMMALRLTVTSVALTLALGTAIAPAQDCLQRVGRAPHGVAQAVVADGGLAYLGNGAELTILDLGDPSNPMVLGTLDLPYPIRALALDGDRLYAATLHHVHVIDVSVPSSPSLLGSLERFEVKYRMSASGNLLCYTNSVGVRVVNVSDPSNPVVVGTWSNAAHTDVELIGDHAFVTAGGSLRTIDLSDPSVPTQIGSLDNITGELARKGNLLYSASNTFAIVDVTTPAAPVLVSSSPTLGGSDVAVAGDLVFLANGGLDVVDVSNPASPSWTGYWGWNQGAGQVASVAAIEDNGLATTYSSGLRVVDATTPTAPDEIAAVDSPGLSPAVAYADGVLAVTQAGRGLRTLDVSDPTSPVELAILDLEWLEEGIDVVGDRAYVVGTYFWVVDISDPTTPVLLGETHFSGFDVEVVGSVAYVAALSRGLVTVDVTNPAIPFEIGNLDFGDDEFEHIDVLGDIAVLRGPTIEVVDITDPSSPLSLSTIDDSMGVSGGVAMMGRWLFVPNGSLLHVFDLVDPTQPVEVVAHAQPRNILSIGVAGTVVYLGPYAVDISYEVESWDMVDPLNPVLMGTHGEAGDVMDFAFSDEHVFTSRYASGVDVFTLCQGPIFADGFETSDTAAWSVTVP